MRGGRIGRGVGRGRGAWRYSSYKRGGGSRGFRGGRGYERSGYRGKWSESENEDWKRVEEVSQTNSDCDVSKLEDKNESRDFEQFAKLDQLYVVGDSFALRLTKAIDSTVKGKFNLCKGGLQIKQLKQALLHCDTSSFKDQKVLMFIGMNDLQKEKEEDLDGDLYSLVSKILKMDVEQLYVCTLPTLPGTLTNDIENFNEKVKELSVIDGRICIIDLELIFVKDDDTIDQTCYEKCHFDDKFDIHPNTAGFKKIYEVIQSHL